MFKDIVSFENVGISLPKVIMPNVQGNAYQGDDSFLITLKSLLFGKLGEDEAFNLELQRLYGKWADYVPEIGRPNTITVCYSDGATSQRNFGIFKLFFEESHKEYQKMEKVTAFYQKSFGVVAYVNEQTKSVVIATDRYNLQVHHYLQLSLKAILPWFYQPSDKDEYENVNDMLFSLAQKTSDRYKEVVQVVYSQIGAGLGIPTVCPKCEKHGLVPADGNYFCHECFILFDNELNIIHSK